MPDKQAKGAEKVTKENVMKQLQPLADALKVAVTELWTIFVRQSVVKGISSLFTALILTIGAWALKDSIHFYALIPLTIAIVLIYDAIALIGNPKYQALEDITRKTKDFRNAH